MSARTPMWFGAVIILAAAPAAILPFVKGIAAAASHLGILWKLYPLYLAATALCAFLSYPRRREVAWILLGVMLLAHIAIFMLAREYAL